MCVKFYTRSGDRGDTSLYSGVRIKKSEKRVAAYGGVDELNSVLGLARSFISDEQTKQILFREQIRLFTLGADLATPLDAKTPKPLRRISEADIKEVEDTIDTLKASPPHAFIVPGSSQSSALLHLARTVCRRVERDVWALCAEDKQTNTATAVYLNRLSSLLFTLAVYVNQKMGVAEDYWQPDG
ncbi:ATP:cob(I)alamin adenosyltransferase [Candidatus Marsarchaeota G2 archaeon BE_D]|uniref:ATP:cob(I)alamin adenosyltransferase n=1 Tax=Candidatus Marsarchaeota G2 archaeon BE_D TaxID=1978158 RepID=A0A2R6CCR2_9ARCH|nr:MAG: ATP:cob(I)alamin adenosyltransferase [Candidatus Marsarchaeota G2 archaeon BE_D]